MEHPISTLAELQGRHRALAERHAASVGRVTALADRHRTLGAEMTAGISALQLCSDQLAQAELPPTGLAVLWRPRGSRRTALARKSAAEALRAQYEQVATRLREALAFTDELALAGAELQAELERLHQDRIDVVVIRKELTARVLQTEAEFAGLDADAALRREQLEYSLRTDRAGLDRLAVAERVAGEHLGPARTLRDTAWSLHDHMAGYLTTAARVVNRASGRVAVVGILADAPGVVADLHASVRDLDAALAAAERYVLESQRLLTQVLPDLASELDGGSPSGVSGRDAALRASAEAEVEAALGEG